MADFWTSVIVSAVVSSISGIIQIIVVTIYARKTAKEVSKGLVRKELERKNK